VGRRAVQDGQGVAEVCDDGEQRLAVEADAAGHLAPHEATQGGAGRRGFDDEIVVPDPPEPVDRQEVAMLDALDVTQPEQQRASLVFAGHEHGIEHGDEDRYATLLRSVTSPPGEAVERFLQHELCSRGRARHDDGAGVEFGALGEALHARAA